MNYETCQATFIKTIEKMAHTYRAEEIFTDFIIFIALSIQNKNETEINRIKDKYKDTAKIFIEKYQDICFLADLLGHESIDTTRIYVRKTATEQRDIVNRIVDW